MMFYDEAWRELSKRYPLIAKKIEELRCESVAYEQYEQETKELQKRFDTLQKEFDTLNTLVGALMEANGLKRPPQIAAK